MITKQGLEEMARDIAQINGINLQLANEYAALIGDTPELDDLGSERVIVRDESGREIARVILPG
jgi:hypothetical protein